MLFRLTILCFMITSETILHMHLNKCNRTKLIENGHTLEIVERLNEFLSKFVENFLILNRFCVINILE